MHQLAVRGNNLVALFDVRRQYNMPKEVLPFSESSAFTLEFD